jgi:uncharacterized coiled-coil protein SlyX
LKQKDEAIAKYQEMLQLSREEMNKMNQQNEYEINSMIEMMNLSRDTNLQKLRKDLKFSPCDEPIMTQSQLKRLQELEEITTEQDNTISVSNQKIKKLNTEVETWKARYELLIEESDKKISK